MLSIEDWVTVAIKEKLLFIVATLKHNILKTHFFAATRCKLFSVLFSFLSFFLIVKEILKCFCDVLVVLWLLTISHGDFLFVNVMGMI